MRIGVSNRIVVVRELANRAKVFRVVSVGPPGTIRLPAAA